MCVEVSSLHHNILTAIGFNTVQADFLAWAGSNEHQMFDRVVMNPPFSEGRWTAHVKAAAEMVKPGGRLVSILPASAKSSGLLADWDVQWHGPFDNEFAGTGVSVVILVAQKIGF